LGIAQRPLANPFNPTPAKNLAEGLGAIEQAKILGAKTQRESHLISAIGRLRHQPRISVQRARAQVWIKAMEEASEQCSGRELVLSRLVEVRLVEALRTTLTDDASAGLLRGLSDARLAIAIRAMHGDPARSWTVAQLAKAAALSRSAFFDRFMRAVAMPPMEYLLACGWPSPRICSSARMKDLTRWPSGWATARRPPSAPRSAAT